MRIDLLPGTENVLRFPVERRACPTLALLREIAPDMREVWAIAEGTSLARCRRTICATRQMRTWPSTSRGHAPAVEGRSATRCWLTC